MGETSKYLAECLGEFDAMEWATPAERYEGERVEEFARSITKKILRAKSQLSTEDLEFLDRLECEVRESVEEMLDNHYIRWAVKAVPEMVARTMELSSLPVREPPPKGSSGVLSGSDSLLCFRTVATGSRFVQSCS